ncbi:hypothetical protein SAMN05444746_109243 [Variovorax sp. OK212]|nr:hypothetical protein SAMN05518853_109243 [Variovorax sp. OK202]SFD69043.1 hypothetical protein SAMN05444746_109243 [Variovorax sp. OK212]
MDPVVKSQLAAHGWAPAALGLGALALWQPAGLYVVALAVFGLPHVLWEMAWVRKTWAPVLPRAFWLCLGGTLALQACARTMLWLDRIDAETAALCDATTLALALLCALTLLQGAGPRRRWLLVPAATGLAALLVAVADTVHVMGVLAALAIAHNFTPIGLVPAAARIGAWPARAVLGLVFAAPLALFLLLWLFGTGAPATAWRPAELGWASNTGSAAFGAALLPALVWAQCLHYLAVLYLVPRALGPAWKGLPWRTAALAACAAILLGFWLDFAQAKGLYAIAAGLHAWTEWPLILLALMGAAKAVLPAVPRAP